MLDDYERGLGMSLRCEPFNGMLKDWGPPSNPVQLRDIERIHEEAAKELKGRRRGRTTLLKCYNVDSAVLRSYSTARDG